MKRPELIDIDGIKLIYEKVETNNNFALLPIFLTGSIDETDENSGVTHFLEHMLAKETKNKSIEETTKILQKYFPRYSASTGINRMLLECETSLKFVDIGFEFFADIVLNSKFDNAKVKKESKVIEQEIVRYDAENDAVAGELMEKTVFSNPFAQNGILGNRDNVLSTTSEDLEKRYNQLVCKENMVFSFAGNLEKERVIELIKKYFSALPSKPENKISAPILEYNKDAKVALIKRESERCNVILARKLNTIANDENQILCRSILNYYLNRLMGKLWIKLREEKGLVYSYYCYNRKYSNKFLNIFEFETYKQNIRECLVCYAEVLKDIYLNGINLEDFENIKDNYLMMNDAFIPSPYANASTNFKTYAENREFLTIDEKNKLIENLSYDQFIETIKPMLFEDVLTLSIVGDVDEDELISINELKELFKKPE